MTETELKEHISECQARIDELFWDWDGSNGMTKEIEAIANGLKDLLERENIHPVDIAIIMLKMSINMGKTSGEIA